jgi:tetratricopeptide (TPR) repeat protein
MEYTRKDIKDAFSEYGIYKSEVLQSSSLPEVINELDIRYNALESLVSYFDSISDEEFKGFQHAPWIKDIIDSMLQRLETNQNQEEPFEWSYDDFRSMTNTGEDPEMAFNSGKFAEKHEDYDGAINDYTNAIKYDPEYINAYLRKSYCFTYTKKFDKAIEDLEAANALGADKDMVKSRIGIIYREAGNLQRALEYQNEAVELNPKNPENYFNRAMTKVLMGINEGALFDFDTCLTIQPDFWEAMHPYFEFHMSQNNFIAAINIVNKMIQLRPQNGALYYNRGIAQMKIGDKSNSKNDFLKAESLGFVQASSILKSYF